MAAALGVDVHRDDRAARQILFEALAGGAVARAERVLRRLASQCDEEEWHARQDSNL